MFSTLAMSDIGGSSSSAMFSTEASLCMGLRSTKPKSLILWTPSMSMSLPNVFNFPSLSQCYNVSGLSLPLNYSQLPSRLKW